MKNQILAALTTLCFTLAAPLAHATTIHPVSGQVMVNQGNGYKIVKNPMHLQKGDTLIVNPGGVAKINYTDGCAIQVTPGSVVIVGAQSPCAVNGTKPETVQTQGGMVQTQTAEGAPAAAGGSGTVGGAGAAGAGAAGAAAAGAAGGITLGTISLVALGVAGIAGIAAAASGGGDSKKTTTPASP